MMDYQRHAYLRLLKTIEWYSAFSSGPGVDRFTLNSAMYDLCIGTDAAKETIVLAAATAGHIKVLEVAALEKELVMLTPEGHDYLYRFTRSAETGTKWDEAFMGCKPRETPSHSTTQGLLRREVR
jgi:hypothetical protein